MSHLRRASALFVIASATTAIQAQNSVRPVDAREMWRVDGSESGEPFGEIRDYIVNSDGTVWILDYKDQTIRRYDLTGKALAAVGRKGKGPGELTSANGLVLTPSGSVWANDPSSSRVSIFSRDGKFERQIIRSAGGYMYTWGAWYDKKSGNVVEPAFGNSAVRWRHLTPAGDTGSSFAFTSCPDGSKSPDAFNAKSPGRNMISSYPFSTGGGLAPVGDGTAWCAGARATTVARMDMIKSDTVSRTTTVIPAVALPAAERDSVIKSTELRLAQYATNDFDKSKVPTSKPGIEAVFVDLDGRLWVRHTKQQARKSTVFDLHDSSGRHIARVTFNARVSSQPLRARGNDVWLTILDDDDVPSVAKFTMR